MRTTAFGRLQSNSNTYRPKQSMSTNENTKRITVGTQKEHPVSTPSPLASGQRLAPHTAQHDKKYKAVEQFPFRPGTAHECACVLAAQTDAHALLSVTCSTDTLRQKISYEDGVYTALREQNSVPEDLVLSTVAHTPQAGNTL